MILMKSSFMAGNTSWLEIRREGEREREREERVRRESPHPRGGEKRNFLEGSQFSPPRPSGKNSIKMIVYETSHL
jgi:hypothetical protein